MRRASAAAGGAARLGAVHFLRKSFQSSRLRGAVGGAAGGVARAHAAGRGTRLLGEDGGAPRHRLRDFSRGVDRAETRDGRVQSYHRDVRCARRGRFADRVSRGHARRWTLGRRVQARHPPPCPVAAERETRARVSCEPQSDHAQGHGAAGAAHRERRDRRATRDGRRRNQGGVSRPGTRRPSRSAHSMNALRDPQLLWLLGGILVLLVISSIITSVLVGRTGPEGPSPTIANLAARVRAWWMMVIVFSLALVTGGVGSVVLFALMSFMALREFITLTPSRPADHLALFAAFFMVLPFQYVLTGIQWYGFFAVFVPVYAFVAIAIFAVVGGDAAHYLERTAKIQWGLMVCVYFLSHVPALLMIEIPGYAGQNAKLLLFVVLVGQSSDVLQYVWGKLLGRHKVAPVLSPSKTWEGLIGGVLSASALGAALWWATPFTWWAAALFALLITVMGFFGGLVMSAIKRDRGVKDYGSMIEGHGGMMDRIDSLCFSAPVFFHLLRYFYVP